MSLDAIKETYFAECVDHIAEIQGALTELVANDPKPELINLVFRAVHSIKGGAGAFSFDELSAFAHVIESALDIVRSDISQISATRLELLQRAADLLEDFVLAKRNAVPAPDSAELVKSLEQGFDMRLEQNEVATDVEFEPVPISIEKLDEDLQQRSQGDFEIVFKPRSELYLHGHEPQRLFRDIARFGQCRVVADTSSITPLDSYEPEEPSIFWRISLETAASETEIRSTFSWVENLCELSVKRTYQSIADPSSADISAFLDVDLDCAGTLDQEAASKPSVAKPSSEAKRERKGDIAKIESGPRLPDGVPTIEIREPDRSNKAALSKKTIRVDSERVDRLMNLMGEMVISQSMLASQLQKQMSNATSPAMLAFSELQALTNEIQSNVMGMRAQPIKPVFLRMSRVIREASAATGKKANLTFDGEQTEVDSTVIEGLTEPLMHLVRNCVDHGIEDVSKRIADGKAEAGEIRLSATHNSGSIVIEVSDDGAGIDRERVLEVAVKNGLVKATTELTDHEIDNLIFEPGFTTSESISNISGRGVGMDVVRQSIQSFGGRVTVNSESGVGSRFTLVLPLTLAILDGMLVDIAEQILVVPIGSIIETLSVKPADIFHISDGHHVIKLRGQLIPIVDIGHDLGFKDVATKPDGGTFIVVESASSATCAFLVDTIIGQQQVVVKSLEKNYRRIPKISSATILGTGQIALILDVEQIATRRANDNIQMMSLDKIA